MQDTLMYVKKLEAVGVPRNQAEVQVEIMSQFVDSNFASKQDLKDLSTELRAEMRDLKTELKAEMGGLRLEIRDTTLKHGKMLAAAVGIIIAAMGIMLKI